MSSRITRVGTRSRLALAAGVLVGLLGCEDYSEPGAAAPVSMSAIEMSAYVPTADLYVDEGDFARMSARPLDDIEIPGTLTLWRAGEAVCTDDAVELQIKGSSSAAAPTKALGVKFDRALRNRAGEFMRVPHVRAGHNFARVKAFRLRNGGNNFATSLLKDLAYARLVAASDLDVLCLYGEPAATYVNGEFYSLHNLRTENNTNGISRLLDVDEERLRLASVEDTADELEIKAGPAAPWRRLEAAVRDGRREEVLARLHVPGFIDFLVAGAVFATQDWPHRNVRLYSVDGEPVRFVLYDFDFAGQAFTRRSPYDFLERGRPSLIRSLFLLCYSDEAFRSQLEARYAETVQSGVLSDERLRAHFTELAAVYAPVIDQQIARNGYPASRPSWYVDMETSIGDYAQRYRQLPATFE